MRVEKFPAKPHDGQVEVVGGEKYKFNKVSKSWNTFVSLKSLEFKDGRSKTNHTTGKTCQAIELVDKPEAHFVIYENDGSMRCIPWIRMTEFYKGA